MSHYFINDENLVSNIQEFSVSIQNCLFHFKTDNGVFSKKELDFGSKLLIETVLKENIQGEVLDLGCGYGPIGITVKDNTNSNVDMIDINLRSLHLARMNASKNNVSVNVFESNGYSNVLKKYDYIITNPPIRVGKKILYDLLFGAKEHLKENGELWLVINKNQGAKSVAKDLEKEYNVEIVKKNKGFYIIMAKVR